MAHGKASGRQRCPIDVMHDIAQSSDCIPKGSRLIEDNFEVISEPAAFDLGVDRKHLRDLAVCIPVESVDDPSRACFFNTGEV